MDDTIWDTNEMPMLSPSTLYHIEPLGMGTPYVESLTSFLKRLAQAHHLTVAKLVSFCCTQTQEDLMPTTVHKLLWIDGITPFAEKWAHLVSKLTCQSAVIYLTMANWKGLLNGYKLLRHQQAWCPQCYEAWAKNGQPIYEPLLWRLQGVHICLVHRCPLVDCCPACSQRFVAITGNGTVGFCAKCRAWLGHEFRTSNTVATNPESEQFSQTVAQFLTLTPEIPQHNANAVVQTVEMLHWKRRMAYTHISGALQIGINPLQSLRAGQTLPNLNTLVRLSWLSEMNLPEILDSSARDSLEHSTPSQFSSNAQKAAYLEQLLVSTDLLPAFAHIAHTCGLANAVELQRAFPEQYERLRARMNSEQEQALRSVLQRESIVTVAQLARSRGEHQADLYRNFPDLCKQVMLAYHEQNKARCNQYLQEIIRSGRATSVRAVAKALGIDEYYLTQWFEDELNLVRARYLNHKQQQSQKTQQQLEAALASELLPPICLAQVAADLGISTKTLKRNFPVHSQKILDRRREYEESQVQATCDHIREVVIQLHEQNIYPSVDRLHAAIGTWMVHGKSYRSAYIEAMTACGYRDVNTKSSLRRYISD